mmetsp:Transcript_40523/g.52161  ORF Transcript_40523/g.52161 Transcript_40523/m.52161 type:complete len:521 (-) Transcript_40523:142-1704(-)
MRFIVFAIPLTILITLKVDTTGAFRVLSVSLSRQRIWEDRHLCTRQRLPVLFPTKYTLSATSGLPEAGAEAASAALSPLNPLSQVDTTVQLPQGLPENVESLITLGVLMKRILQQIGRVCVQLWGTLPNVVRQVISPRDLVVWLVFQLVYRRFLKTLHKVVSYFSKRFKETEPKPYDESVLGFLEPKLGTFSRLLGLVYVSNGVLSLLTGLQRFETYKKIHKIAAKILYLTYSAYVCNEAKTYFLPIWVPQLKQDNRKNYILQKSSSVLLWTFCIIAVMDSISSFLGVPISSTLAFGGISGIAFGLGSKDVISNILGGLVLLVSEPFTPGDMVTFRYQGEWYEGKVERVGWYQTRVRGKDTRPTYVPNSIFMSSMVTNMDRITHRRFVAQVHLRYEDLEQVPQVLQEMKQALRELPKVDLLSPFRIHFVRFSETAIVLEAYFFFATKNLDEFLFLQQTALLEIGRVIEESGAKLAYPTSSLDVPAGALKEAVFGNSLPPPAPTSTSNLIQYSSSQSTSPS